MRTISATQSKTAFRILYPRGLKWATAEAAAYPERLNGAIVDALVKADKDFEFVLLPTAGHGAAETPYGHRRRMDFLERKLLGDG